MLDLPLRDRAAQPQLPFESVEPDVRPSSPPPAPPPRQRRKSTANRKRLIVVVVGALLGMIGAYLVLWPKPPAAQFSEDPFVMQKVRLGREGALQELTITNIGERPMPVEMLSLTGSQAEEFKIESDGCGAVVLEPMASCAVQLKFIPAAMGVRQATLEVHAEMPDSPAGLPVSGEGIAPLLSVEPAVLRFGSHDVGTNSGAGDVRVVNEGTAALVIERVGLGGSAERDFRVTRNDCSKSTLDPGESCSLRMIFVPRAAGARHAELVFASDALEPVPEVELEGEGIWTGAAFDVQPRALDFGRHLVGTKGRLESVTLTNRQGTSLDAIRVSLAEGATGFALGKDSCGGKSVASGESCRIEVVFSPPEDGQFRSLLQVSQGKIGTLGIDLQGQGVAPRWVLGTEAVDFGDRRVGEEPGEPLAVELRNEGSAGAKVTEVELAGGDARAFAIAKDGCRGQAVSPGSDCKLHLRFQPSREGEHRAELLLHVEAGASPQRLALRARAVAPRLSLDREILDFDRVRRTTTGQVDLLIANGGTAPLEVGPFTIAEDGSGNFSVSGGSCGVQATLAPGSRCTITVAFSPTIDGRTTAQLEIQHDGISGPRSVPLAGTGLPPPMPRITVEESILDFGPQPVGNRSSILTVNIRAGGTGNLDFREFELAGANAADFRIVPATCHAAPFLLPGTSCAVGIRFTPAAAGQRSAELVIRHNAETGLSRVRLVGEGLGSPPG
jgi:hypothetical protein